jgi:hypothetical protein
MWHQTGGIPVEGFEPSPEGPPRGSEAYPFGWREGIYPGALHLEKRVVSYHPVTLPPVRSVRTGRIGGCIATVLLGLAVVLVAGVAAALISQYGWLSLSTHARTSPGVGRGLATAAAVAPSCLVSTHTLATPARLDQVEMTTGLRDSSRQDYRPVDDVSSSFAGERGYVTFKIVTSQAGTVSILFCLPSRMIVGTLPVPSNSQGRFGEFEIDFTSEDIGQGEAILYWGTRDDWVTAMVRFTVRTT